MNSKIIEQLTDLVAQKVTYRLLSSDLVAMRAGERVPLPENLGNTQIALGRFLGSLARLDEALTDLEKIPRFGRRFPWKSTQFSRVDHIRFVWMLFLHLAYTYEERTKLFLKQIEEISAHVPVKCDVNFKRDLADIKPIIGKYTRERGQHLYEWPRDREEIQHVGMLELLSAWGRKSPDDVKRHYDDARADMLHTIRATHLELSVAFATLVERHKDVAIQLAERFSVIQLREREQGVEISALNTSVIQAAPSFSKDRIASMRKQRVARRTIEKL